MTALPSVNEAERQGLISHDEIALDLYSDVVLPAEKAATETGNSNNAVMFSRIVGYLLLYPPSKDARIVLKSEIELCKHESGQSLAIYDLGETYFKHFIQVFCESSFQCHS